MASIAAVVFNVIPLKHMAVPEQRTQKAQFIERREKAEFSERTLKAALIARKARIPLTEKQLKQPFVVWMENQE